MFVWQRSHEPFYAARWDRLRNCAVEILTERELAYPSLVAAGKMEQAAADDGIRVARAIVADWQRIVDLRAGREAAPRDRTAAPAEKHSTYVYFHRRSVARFEKAKAAFEAALAGADSRAIGSGAVSLYEVYEAWKAGHPVYRGTVYQTFFEAGRRFGATHAMLWHAERQPGPMFYAETQAALIVADPRRKDRAA